MWYFSARFSAVMPIGILTCRSVRPAHKVSSSCQADRERFYLSFKNFWSLIPSCLYSHHMAPCTFVSSVRVLQRKEKIYRKPTLRSTPNLVPNLMLRTAYGAWLMLSEPPHRTTSESLRQISYKHTQNRFLF